MEWLGRHMREFIGDSDSIDSPQNILSFPGAPTRYDGSAALDLVSQATEMIRGIQDRAFETETRAKTLVERAIEKVRLTEARIKSAETARIAAEENLCKVSAKLREAERELARTVSRIANAEIQLTNAEQRIREAEMRAANSEKAVKQIEQAIVNQLAGLERGLTRQSANAA
jgi:chromosome segregation ATPase